MQALAQKVRNTFRTAPVATLATAASAPSRSTREANMKLLSEWLLENAHPEQHGGTPLTDAEKVDLFKAYAQMTEQVQNQNLVVLVGYQGSLPILSGVRIRRGAALETTTAADTTLLELSKRLIGPDNVPEDLQRAIHFVAYNGTLAEALTSAGYA